MEKEVDNGSKHHGIPDEILDGMFAEKDKGKNNMEENIECTSGTNSSKQLGEKEASQMSDHMKNKIKTLYVF